MSLKAIISDWNGTLFQHLDDAGLQKKIASELINHQLKSMNILKALSLVQSTFAIKKMLKKYHAGGLDLREIYEVFNENLLKGTEVEFIKSIVSNYAKSVAHLIDSRMMLPIANNSSGKFTAVVSGSYDYYINSILHSSQIAFRAQFAFDDIIGCELEEQNGIVNGFKYGTHLRKKEIILSLMEEKQLSASEVIYFGDTAYDETVAELLKPGNFIAPFLAQDEFKQHMATVYNAQVPESQEELERMLKLM